MAGAVVQELFQAFGPYAVPAYSAQVAAGLATASFAVSDSDA